MKAYRVRGSSGIDSLTLDDNVEIPEPGHGEVQIKVRACSLNYRDLLIVNGAYGAGVKDNVIPVSDGAGEVSAIGPGVENIEMGDRVVGAFFPNWITGQVNQVVTQQALGGTTDGMLAEYVVLPQRAVLTFPEHLSYAEASTLPCAALTAWNALFETGNLQPGQTVLLQGTGGVSIFALQFAKMAGAEILITSSSDKKLARAVELGATHLINYRTNPDWHQQALTDTGGRGVDLIVEVGGAGTLERSLQAIRMGGTVATIGIVSGIGKIDPVPLIIRAIKLDGVYVGSHEMFADMCRAMAAHEMRPVIDQIIPLADAKEAYKYMESGGHFGKVVVGVAEDDAA